jgi:two-component system NtrC family sensor kinase
VESGALLRSITAEQGQPLEQPRRRTPWLADEITKPAETSPVMNALVADAGDSVIIHEKVLQSQKLASLGQLIASVAHDLNNPLTTVLGFAEMMLQEDHLPDSVKGDLETIHDAAEQARQIVRNILTFAHQHRGPKPLVAINDLIERTLSLRAYEFKVNNIEVVKDLASDLPLTTADPYQLQQVFLNLIVNAEQAMTEAHGRGRLVIQTRTKHRGTPGDWIEIRIMDDGPGISADHLDSIFEPFFTTKPVGQGTGLGLSISRGIIADHGGTLSARTELGRGATFIIELPVEAPSESPAPHSCEQPLPSHSSSKRVLIIDDEPAVVKLLAKIVAAEGHRVATAANGAQALTMLEETSYDLIICDTRMPRLNGRDLYYRVKQLSEPLARRIVFVTGDATSDEPRAFFQQTGSRYLEKPFTRQDIVRMLRTMLADETV